MKKLLALIVLFPISSGLSGSETGPPVANPTSASTSTTPWAKKASKFTGKTIGEEAREAFFRQAFCELLNELGGSSTATKHFASKYLASIMAKCVVTLAAAQEQGRCLTLKQAGTDVVSAGLGQGAIDGLSWIGNQGTEFAGRGCKKLGLSLPKFMQQGTSKACLDTVSASAKTLAQWFIRSSVSGAVGSKLNPTQPADKPVGRVKSNPPSSNQRTGSQPARGRFGRKKTNK